MLIFEGYLLENKNLFSPHQSSVKSFHCSLSSTDASHLHKTKSGQERFVVVMLSVLVKNHLTLTPDKIPVICIAL